MSLAVKPIASRRPTYSAAYLVVGDELRPTKPNYCILSGGHAGMCRIICKGRRWRKIGIEGWLYVFGCREHDVFFVVYPLGWAQYGRRPLVELAHDGSEIDVDLTGDDAPDDGDDAADATGTIDDRADGCEHATCDGADAMWLETAFGAAVDAKLGRQWPLTALGVITAPEPKPYGVFSTQKRHIAGILRLFRIDATASDKERERVAANLPISFAALRETAGRVRDGPQQGRWRHDGKEAAATTQTLTPPRRWLKHLLELGAAMNFWGSPMYG